MIGETIEKIIKDVVNDTLNKAKKVELSEDIIETDNIGEVIEKLSILHCRMWYLEDAIGIAKTDEEIADLKRKIDICFKVKRPKLVSAINKMIEKSILDGKSLIEDSVKLYQGFDEGVKIHTMKYDGIIKNDKEYTFEEMAEIRRKNRGFDMMI